MTFRVIISHRARIDLFQGLAWWSEHRSHEQAARWFHGICEAIESLGHNPQVCPLARENGLAPFEVRELHYGLGKRPTHRALFTIHGETVRVLHIRHTAQADLLPEDF